MHVCSLCGRSEKCKGGDKCKFYLDVPAHHKCYDLMKQKAKLKEDYFSLDDFKREKDKLVDFAEFRRLKL